MNHQPRDALRIAMIVRHQVEALARRYRGDLHTHVYSTANALDRFKRLSACLTKAHRHHWLGAEHHLIACLQQSLRELTSTTSELGRAMDVSTPQVPTLRQVYEELEQIQQEFGGWS